MLPDRVPPGGTFILRHKGWFDQPDPAGIQILIGWYSTSPADNLTFVKVEAYWDNGDTGGGLENVTIYEWAPLPDYWHVSFDWPYKNNLERDLPHRHLP